MLQCPKCAKKGKTALMRVTHTYACGLHGSMQRVFCDTCLTAGAARSQVVAVDPPRGKGAEATAKRLRQSAQVAVAAGEGD